MHADTAKVFSLYFALSLFLLVFFFIFLQPKLPEFLNPLLSSAVQFHSVNWTPELLEQFIAVTSGEF